MTCDIFLLTLKYAGSIVSALYGLYATVTDFYEQKDGQKVLSRKGWWGLALLVASTVLTMGTDVYKDWKEAGEREVSWQRERVAQQEARVKEEHLLSQIAETSRSLQRTYRMTDQVLKETVERLDFLEIEIRILADPFAIKDASGALVIPPELVQALEEDRTGVRQLETPIYRAIIDSLSSNYNLVRKAVFQGWELSFSLNRGEDRDPNIISDMNSTWQQEDGLAGFRISYVSDERPFFDESHRNARAIVCYAIYHIAPNRISEFRKYSDLNGARWGVAIRSNPNILYVTGATLDAGPSGAIKISKLLEIRQRDNSLVGGSFGRYVGGMEIPPKHFK